MKKTTNIESFLEDLKKSIDKIIELAYEENEVIIKKDEIRISCAQKKLKEDIKSANEALVLFEELFPGKNISIGFYNKNVLQFFDHNGNLLEGALRKELIVHHKVNTSGIKTEEFSKLYEFNSRDEEIINDLKKIKVLKLEDDLFDSTSKSFKIHQALLDKIESDNTVYIESEEEFAQFVNIYLFKEGVNSLQSIERFLVSEVINSLPSSIGSKLKTGPNAWAPTVEINWSKLKKLPY